MSAPMNEVIPDRLWLGDGESSGDKSALEMAGITHILTAGHCLAAHFPLDYHYLILKVWDWEVEDLLRFLIPTFRFIEHALQQNGRVLVHCKAGQSRSATLVVSYLMWKNSWSLSETLQYMKKKRKIYPNVGFKFQLQLLDELLALPFEGHS